MLPANRTARDHMPAFCAHSDSDAADGIGVALRLPELVGVELDALIPRRLDHRLQAGREPGAAAAICRPVLSFCYVPAVLIGGRSDQPFVVRDWLLRLLRRCKA